MPQKSTPARVRRQIAVGEKFGRWTVVGASEKRLHVCCQCQCGTVRDVACYTLRKGLSTGCRRCGGKKEIARVQIAIGTQFGNWTTAGPVESGTGMVPCRCACGTEKKVAKHTLESGTSKSCGCLMVASRTARNKEDGIKNYPEYHVWQGMKGACQNPNSARYKHVGELGVKVCERWNSSFVAFLEDVGRRPNPGDQLVRIDSLRDYEPGNVRWGSAKDVRRSAKSSPRYEFQGRSLTLIEWSEATGLPKHVIHGRLRSGRWTVEAALTTPVRQAKAEPKVFSRAPVDLIGQRFGRFTVIAMLPRPNTHHVARNVCRCDCGNERVLLQSRLLNGKHLSCGCLAKENLLASLTTHGKCKSDEYQVWWNMVARCTYECVRQYKDYGGRGIKVCARWRDSFEAFLADMGSRPTPGHSIERINNDGDYCPENCKWAERLEQARNKRNNRWITFNGKTQTLTEWCRETGLAAGTLSHRLKTLGWTVERALTTPSGGNKASLSSGS